MQLSWIFRNFKFIPLNVLSASQAALVEDLRLHGPYVQLKREQFEVVLLGTIEYPRHTEKRPLKKPSHRLAEVVAFTPRNLAPQRASSRQSTNG